LNLLTNDEVIDINQDPLGKQAVRVVNENGKQIWVKELEDGSKAVGLFFTGNERKNPVDYFQWDGVKSAKIVLHCRDIGIKGTFRVRDLWRQTDIGSFNGQFETDVLYHGVVLIKVTEVK